VRRDEWRIAKGERAKDAARLPYSLFATRPEKPLSARFVQKIAYQMPASGKAITYPNSTSYRPPNSISQAEGPRRMEGACSL
jgi:hypothetical protein